MAMASTMTSTLNILNKLVNEGHFKALIRVFCRLFMGILGAYPTPQYHSQEVA